MPAKMSEEAKKKISASMKGNVNSARTKIFQDALRRKLVQDPARVDRIIENLLTLAEAGDMTATRELLDRSDGKAVAIQEISGPDGSPIETKASIDFAKMIADELLLAKQKENK